VEQKRFRQDLYYRLSVVPIRVPPLREHIEDIKPLGEYFLDEFCRRNNFKARQIDGDVWAILGAYRWPGNVRELRNVIERMAILAPSEVIAPESVPLEIRIAPEKMIASSLEETRTNAERGRILLALEDAGWNVSAAARALGIERTSLHKRIRALGLASSNKKIDS
jgi:two-component system nitrogen regulation response regulator NtrX